MVTLSDKMLIYGVESLTNRELLTLLLDEGDEGERFAQQLLDSYGDSPAQIGSESLSRLRMFEGLGLRRAIRIIAGSEWGRRSVVADSSEQKIIETKMDVVDIFRPIIGSVTHEECWVLYLNSANRVVESMRVSQGGVTTTVVDQRIIIKRALELLSTKIILVHNHPSGSCDPSESDRSLTRVVSDAAKLFDIKLLDHIIISSSREYSFRESGLL